MKGAEIRKELLSMLQNNKEEYIKFFKAFGPQIKFGIYNNFGIDKDKLKDLLIFYSSKAKDYISLKEYIDNIDEKQDKIYYCSGESIEKIDSLPLVERVKEKGYDILYLIDMVDEFAINALNSYENKQFQNITDSNLDIDSEEEKKKNNKINEDNKELLNSMKEILNIDEVKFTNKLKNHPVCITSKGNVSIEMEKVLNAMPTEEKIQAQIVLEINENHPIKNKLEELFNNNKEEFNKYSKILYSEARLIEGLPIDNPTEISNLICDIISK